MYYENNRVFVTAHASDVGQLWARSVYLGTIGEVRQDAGLEVPKDMSFVSYVDIPIANYLVPRLTTVTKDALTLGKNSVPSFTGTSPKSPPSSTTILYAC